MVIFVYGSAFGECVTVDIHCDEAECKGICQQAYGDRLTGSFCQDLPSGLGRLCVCLHKDGSTTMVANDVLQN